MSDLDQSSLGSLQDAARARETELAAIIGERAEREGLPRNYRMRADAHYVDQLDRPQGGPVVRLIAARHIDAGDLPPASSLAALGESIAAHGLLQPLLVRRNGNRYQLIAGRKRFAAAVGGGLAELPCIVHEISEAAARTLAEAEQAAAAPAAAEASPAPARAVLSTLAQDLARIGSLADVLELASTPFHHRTAADFLKAEAWRATWLVSAAAILADAQPSGHTLPVARLLDRIRSGFEPEMRLAKLQLETSAAAEAADLPCDERLATVVTGLIFAAASALHGAASPRIEVRADAPAGLHLRIQIVQRQAAPPAGGAGDVPGQVALAAAREIAAQHGGSVEVAAAGPRGAVVQVLLARAPFA